MASLPWKPAGAAWYGKTWAAGENAILYSSVNFGSKRDDGPEQYRTHQRPAVDLNLKEIKECIKLFPDRAMVVSLMADNDRKSWHELIKKWKIPGRMDWN